MLLFWSSVKDGWENEVEKKKKKILHSFLYKRNTMGGYSDGDFKCNLNPVSRQPCLWQHFAPEQILPLPPVLTSFWAKMIRRNDSCTFALFPQWAGLRRWTLMQVRRGCQRECITVSRAGLYAHMQHSLWQRSLVAVQSVLAVSLLSIFSLFQFSVPVLLLFHLSFPSTLVCQFSLLLLVPFPYLPKQY